MWSIILGIPALLIALAAAYYAKRSAGAADRSAHAAEAVEPRERTPRLTVLLDNDELTTHGGKDSGFFLGGAYKGFEQRLLDVADRVGDTGLKRHLQSAAQSWNKAWALAPPTQIVVNPDSPANAETARRRDQVAEKAREGRWHRDNALARLNQLQAG